MESILTGLGLVIVGLVSAFFGYRLFRILLPIYGAIAGFMLAWGWLGQSAWLAALAVGVVLGIILGFLAYTIWSVLIGLGGIVFGVSLAALIATSLGLGTWLAVILAVVLAAVFGLLFVMIRNPMVIIVTAAAGGAAVARGLGEWLGLQSGLDTGSSSNPTWLLLILAVLFVAVAVVGGLYQWGRYRRQRQAGEPPKLAPELAASATRGTQVPVAASAVEASAAPAAAVGAVAVVAVAAAHADEVPAEAAVTSEEALPVAAGAVVVQADEKLDYASAVASADTAEAAEPVAEVAAEAETAIAETVEAPSEAAAVAGEAVAESGGEAALAAVAVANKVEEALSPGEEATAVDADTAGANVVEEVVKEIEETYSFDDIAKFKEKLEYVEGIGASYAEKLVAAGIETVLDLLKRGATRKGRSELVEATGISGKLILRWVNHADLYRVKGVGSEYADLLEAAGVDTVPELATRNPANLFSAVTETNKVRKLVRKEPVASQIEDWVAQAKKLPRVIQY